MNQQILSGSVLQSQLSRGAALSAAAQYSGQQLQPLLHMAFIYCGAEYSICLMHIGKWFISALPA